MHFAEAVAHPSRIQVNNAVWNAEASFVVSFSRPQNMRSDPEGDNTPLKNHYSPSSESFLPSHLLAAQYVYFLHVTPEAIPLLPLLEKTSRPLPSLVAMWWCKMKSRMFKDWNQHLLLFDYCSINHIGCTKAFECIILATKDTTNMIPHVASHEARKALQLPRSFAAAAVKTFKT